MHYWLNVTFCCECVSRERLMGDVLRSPVPLSPRPLYWSLWRCWSVRGRPPNVRNSEVLTEWIETGNCIEPFRALYPAMREVSYLPFRGIQNAERYSKTRLDFFLVNRDLIGMISGAMTIFCSQVIYMRLIFQKRWNWLTALSANLGRSINTWMIKPLIFFSL